MPRDPYPHEELVQELRRILCSMRHTSSISDDMDQYYVEAAGYSPMERIMEENARGLDRADAVAEELVAIGPAAAEAVALGLRMQGAWRQYLVPYVRAHGGVGIVAEAVRLVRKRERDPLRELV